MFVRTFVLNNGRTGKPARENIYDVMSWIHLPEPRIVIYVRKSSIWSRAAFIILQIHHVCDGDGKCSRLLEAQTQMIARQMGMPAQQPLCLPKEPGAEYPLSSSCAKCHGEATGAPGSKLSRCGTCKLTRFVTVVDSTFCLLSDAKSPDIAGKVQITFKDLYSNNSYAVLFAKRLIGRDTRG